MELVFIGVVVLIGIIMLLWINMARISRLEKRIDMLDRYAVYNNMDVTKQHEWGAVAPDEKGFGPEVEEPVKQHEKPKVIPASVPIQASLKHEPSEKEQSQKPTIVEENTGIEFDLMSKLPVWIGSASIILAIFFLVKYSIEYGLFGPVTRVSLGTLSGIAMVGASLWLHRKTALANYERIAQGIAGAGIAALYVCVYASANLYGFIGVPFGFVLMFGITVAAVFLALRIGQPIALLGLFGGVLTPALMSTGDANAAGLFGYLFLLYGSIIAMTASREWWRLSFIALACVYGWAFIWFAGAFKPEDSLIYVLFLMGISIITLLAGNYRLRRGDDLPSVHILNIATLGASMFGIIIISSAVVRGLFDWAMLGLLSLAFIALALKHQDMYRLALIAKIAVMHVFYMVCIHDASIDYTVGLSGFFLVLYFIMPQGILMKSREPAMWPVIQTFSSGVLLTVTYLELSLYRDFDSMIWAGMALGLAAIQTMQARYLLGSKAICETTQAKLIAMYIWVANMLILFAAAIIIPFEYWGVTVAAYMVGLGLLYNKFGEKSLKQVIATLLGIFIALNYEQIVLFTSVILLSFTGESNASLGQFVLTNAMFHLGLPALLSYAAFALILGKNKDPKGLANALFGTANVLVMMTGYYLFREVFHDGQGHIFASKIGFVERGIITIMLAAVGLAIIEYTRRHDVSYLKAWGVGLFRMAVIRFVWFDLIMLNPYWSSDQVVGHLPLVNGITLTYGGMMAAFVLMLRHREYLFLSGNMQKLYGALSLISLFVLTSLTIRHFYNGVELVEGSVSVAELYTYSVVWLLTGLSLLAAGLKTDSVELRKASLVFIVLTIGKVFLIDVAELEGLYRVASFMGLGVSLIGLSYFYTKFISDQEQTKV